MLHASMRRSFFNDRQYIGFYVSKRLKKFRILHFVSQHLVISSLIHLPLSPAFIKAHLNCFNFSLLQYAFNKVERMLGRCWQRQQFCGGHRANIAPTSRKQFIAHFDCEELGTRLSRSDLRPNCLNGFKSTQHFP